MHDLIVVGGGPAGMTAALYALRAGKSVMILEKNAFGGQIAFSPKVNNYPGIESMTGSDFADRLFNQVANLGVDFDIAVVTGLDDKGDHKQVYTDEGDVYRARSVIIAVGAKHRQLGVPGESELASKGVCYCAVCDGDFYRGKTVAMVGGGNTALQEAIFLADICQQVTIIQNLDDFTGEASLVHTLRKRENVDYIFGAQVASVHGGRDALSHVKVRRTMSGEELELPLDGLFVAIGLEPENGPFAGLVKLNDHGYIDADENCLTATRGVFVAGDCRSKHIRQLTTATADGTVAALAALRYLT
ncbi:MAG: NAD(P)/FAD-dependent oxidoreductase [Thermoguttaceae bacterium]